MPSPATTSTTPASCRANAPTPCARDISAARSGVLWLMTDAPSGGNGDTQPFSMQITVRAGISANAAPPQPCPITQDTVGTLRPASICKVLAISPAIAASSAGPESSPPGVSTIVTTGRPTRWASRRPRCASRRSCGDTDRRACATTTARRPRIRPNATRTPVPVSPVWVPCSSVRSVSRSRTASGPGRAASRVRVIASQASTSPAGSGLPIDSAASTPSVTERIRVTQARRSCSAMTWSITPTRARFSAVCTGGKASSCSASNTFGPRKPSSAPGSPAVTSAYDPHVALTPPVVGLRSHPIRTAPEARCSCAARAMSVMRKNAAVPSCIRVPPEVGNVITGSRSAVARRYPSTTRSAAE